MWTTEHVAVWDTAVRGSSALKATLARELCHGRAVHEGAASVALHWGLKKLFDTVCPRLLIRLALKANCLPI
eukprot:1961866-Pyramimonas_sp.AAC.1